MTDTLWQREEDKRFYNNSEVVRKISELFGLRILGFNPNWHFELKYPIESSYEISDDFMGKVAVSMGYEWKFSKDIYEEIQCQEEWVNQFSLRLKDRNNENKLLLEKFKEYQTTENIDDIIEDMKKISEFDEKNLSEANEKLKNLKKVVEIRNDLIKNGVKE